MATVKEMKATARPKSGKGAARAERRAGRTPAVIYGDNKPPLAISVDHKDVRTKIYAGRFLTTLYNIDGTIAGLIMALLSAGIGLAGDAFDDPEEEPTSTCSPVASGPSAYAPVSRRPSETSVRKPASSYSR